MDSDVMDLGNYVLQALNPTERQKLSQLHINMAPHLVSYITNYKTLASQAYSARSSGVYSTSNTGIANKAIQNLLTAEAKIAEMEADVFGNIFLTMCQSQIDFVKVRLDLPPENACPKSCLAGCTWERYTTKAEGDT